MLLRSVLIVVMTGLFQAAGAFTAPDNITVGLYVKESIDHIVLTIDEGSYDVLADGKVIYRLEGNRALQVKVSGDQLKLSTWSDPLGSCYKLQLHRRSWGSCFKLKAKSPEKKTRIYNDNLTIINQERHLKMINEVWLEHYVAGVVEAESGVGKSLEYYKAQAILCRTYALRHLDKFIAHGFNLCDNVECQVYKGKSRHDPSILEAVQATDGMVLVDGNLNLITAAFHSNSGGHTVNSEEVWTRPVSYLKGRLDSFSLGQPHATWTKAIPKNKWLNYLQTTFAYPVEDAEMAEYVLDYCPESRDVWLDPVDSIIPLRQVRKDFKLRSTYFNIRLDGELVMLEGRGFGHGVGLSQEGAMNMANLGYSYTDILHFYYKDVHLVDLAVIQFFKEE